MENQSILIIGGGVAGLTAKFRLEALGYAPVLVEKGERLRAEGAGLLLGANVVKLFREMGLEEGLLARAQTLDALVSTDEGGGEIGRIDLARIRRERGYSTVAVHRQALHDLLSSASDPATFRLGRKVEEVAAEEGAYRLRFHDGTEELHRRVVAADGIHSKIRDSLFGPVGLRRTGQACWRCVVETPEGVDPALGLEMWGDRKRLGIIPMGEGKTYLFFVVSMKGGEEELSPRELLALFDGFRGPWEPVRRTLEPESLQLLYGELADGERITLEKAGVPFLGDAGHSTTPNMGQGAAMGIESAWLFGELLREHSWEDATAAYAATRYDRVDAIREKSLGAGKIAHLPFRPVQKMRNLLMRAVPQRMVQQAFEKALFDA